MGKRHNMSGEQKRAAMRVLHEMQGGLCAFCRFAVAHPDSPDRPEHEDDLSPTLEHVIPRGRGGSNRQSNLLLAHRVCNEERGDGRLPKNAHLMWKQNLVLLAERDIEPLQVAA